MMTTLTALDLRPYPMAHWLELLPTLPESRRQRFHACRLEEDRARVVGAAWLLQFALKQAGVPAAEQHFSHNHWGKPFLADREDLQFSLSHSGPWVVCAVSDHPVGVDVELPRCSPAIARRYFHPEEAALADDPEALCRLWTAKEAFVKALGVGLTIPLDSFLVRLAQSGASLEQTQSPLPYQLHEYALEPGRMCLCTQDSRPEIQFVTI